MFLKQMIVLEDNERGVRRSRAVSHDERDGTELNNQQGLQQGVNNNERSCSFTSDQRAIPFRIEGMKKL